MRDNNTLLRAEQDREVWQYKAGRCILMRTNLYTGEAQAIASYMNADSRRKHAVGAACPLDGYHERGPKSTQEQSS